MIKKYSWKNGLKVDTTLHENLIGCVNRVRTKKASLIVVDGGVGEGKTTLAVICSQLLAKEMGQDFDILQQTRQGGSDFLKGMDWCVENNRNVIVYDEAGDFNTRASLTHFNQNMNRVFETYRALGIIVVLCLPSFADIDTSLMKKKIARMLIHCYTRTANFGNYKVYSLWRAWYLKAKFIKVTVPDDAFKFVNPNFYGRFRDLDPKDAEILEGHSVEGKKSIIKKSALADKGMLDIKTVGQRTGYSAQSIRAYIKNNKIETEKYCNAIYIHKELVDAIIRDKEEGKKISY